MVDAGQTFDRSLNLGGPMDTEGFEDLLKRAQKGDESAANRLLETVRPLLKRMAQQYADPEHVAESTSDLVQEVEMRAWQNFDRFSGGDSDEEAKARFLAWMSQIVRHFVRSRPMR